jgi:adenosine deaminase
MNFHHLPKVELHLHLDCSLSYPVVSKIDPSITLADYQNDFIAPDKCLNLADFLTRASSCIRLMQTEEQLRLVTQDLFAQLEQDNVIYAEIRFAPLLHTEQGLSAQDVVHIVEETVTDSIKTTGVEARLLLCTLRHFTESQSLETVKMVEQFQNTSVAGFDIAGDAAGFPVDQHLKAFHYARQNHIPCTAHAGEARGPQSVWDSLHYFYPSRIGHGVRSIEDPVLIEHLLRENIHLEVCPSCNIQTDVYPVYESHSVDQLFESSLSLNINTDARTICNITLTQEYEKLNRAFGWGKEHFLICSLNALQAAFIPQQTRAELITRLLEGHH